MTWRRYKLNLRKHSFRRNLLRKQGFLCALLDKVINGTLGVRSSTYNGYQWDEIMSAMSDVFTSLSPTSRVKKFVFHFTAVCTNGQGRQ